MRCLFPGSVKPRVEKELFFAEALLVGTVAMGGSGRAWHR